MINLRRKTQKLLGLFKINLGRICAGAMFVVLLSSMQASAGNVNITLCSEVHLGKADHVRFVIRDQLFGVPKNSCITINAQNIPDVDLYVLSWMVWDLNDGNVWDMRGGGVGKRQSNELCCTVYEEAGMTRGTGAYRLRCGSAKDPNNNTCSS